MLRFFLLSFSISLLIACGGGGGGGGGSSSNSSTVLEGRFVDSPVDGVAYSSSTQNGMTKEGGKYKYIKDETLTFSIGKISLGSAVGKSMITPVDLVSGALDENNPTVLNIVRLLLTLDKDGNPDNGILITNEVTSAATSTIDFSQTPQAYESDAALLSLLQSQTPALSLVAESVAKDHLKQSLAGLNQDLDDDGLVDVIDNDIDGDDVSNDVDAFPYDSSESADLDEDLIGDNSDADIDGDGVNNDQDVFPRDPSETADFDGDGLGDNSDPDIDGDGIPNEEDIDNTGPTVALSISSPQSLVTVGTTPIEISGSIDQPDAILTINGQSISHTNGSFSAQVSLNEGHNTIEARAVYDNKVVTDVISVSLDVTPPYVTIESHVDGDKVYESEVTVTGLINDIVRGTIEEEQSNVTVNGVAATISNRSYSAAINLVEGLNTITVTGSDQVGNTNNESISLNYALPVGRSLSLIGGKNQSAKINETLAEPFQVKVFDQDENPVEGETVVFRVIQGSGAVGAGLDSEGRAIVVETNEEGVASTKFKVGARVGSANHKVRAAVVGYEQQIVINASATGGVGNKISVNSGNNQRGSVKQLLPEAFVVSVTDSGANVVEGARVEFSTKAGGGVFSDRKSIYLTQTDSDGRATAEFILGSLTGIDAQRVTAKLIDGPEGQTISAGFTASAFEPKAAGDTKISGVVLDNQDTPIPGVTVRIEGSTREALTDAQGQFKITEAPVGPVHLIADGSTATIEGEFPSLSYNLVTISGVDNPLSAPIYMVKIDTENAVYAGLEDAVLELDKFPGFKLEIKKGSVTFPDGTKEGLISATPVNSSKIPMAPPNGMQPQFIVTIQPAGAKFDPPARLTLPNVDAHPVGAQVEMYSFDHDLEEFVSIGLGAVSDDGTTVTSNPGVGVIKAGWHCGSQPGGSGCTHNCPICQDCDGACNCVPAGGDPRLGAQDQEGDCKKPECKDGGVVQVNDDSDVPASAQDCSTCKDGTLNKKDNGATCDDAKYCTSADGKAPGADKCKDGKCEGLAIGRSDVVTGTQSYDFTKIKQILDGATLAQKFIPGCESSSTPSISGSFGVKSAKECCESKKQMVDSVGFEGSVSVTMPQVTCRVPAFTWGFATLTGNFGASGSGELKASGYQSPCEENCDWEVSGAIKVSVSGGLGVNVISPDVLEVSGGLEGGGSLTVTDACGTFSAKGCIGPPSAYGKVIAGGWIEKKITYTFNDLVACYP